MQHLNKLLQTTSLHKFPYYMYNLHQQYEHENGYVSYPERNLLALELNVLLV